MNLDRCFRKMKMKNKGRRGKAYHTKDNDGVPTRRKKNLL